VKQFNDRLSQLIRAYRSPLPKRSGIPAVIIPKRPRKRAPRRSAPPQIQVEEVVSVRGPATPSPPAPVLAPVTMRPARRIPPIKVRPKSPPKVVAQADSLPKRCIVNETINTERLKLARDEAERAMKVHN
jgi:hypothetical protein